jgi:DNA polymerase sigma
MRVHDSVRPSGTECKDKHKMILNLCDFVQDIRFVVGNLECKKNADILGKHAKDLVERIPKETKKFLKRNQGIREENQFQYFRLYGAFVLAQDLMDFLENGTDDSKVSNCEDELLRLDDEIDAMIEMLKPSERIVNSRSRILKNMNNFIHSRISNRAHIEMFGSCATGISLPSSDLDLAIMYPNTPFYDAKATLSSYVLGSVYRNLLHSNFCSEITPILGARIPILKIRFSSEFDRLDADLKFGSQVQRFKDEFLKFFSSLDPRVEKLLILVKNWSKNRAIGDASQQYLNSYAHSISVIYFLQNCNPPVLPVVEVDISVDSIQDFRMNLMARYSNFSSENRQSVSELLISYFFYWAFTFEYDNSVVSLRNRFNSLSTISSRRKRFGHHQQIEFCVEDPLEIRQNVARSLNYENLLNVRAEHARAFILLSSGYSLKTAIQENKFEDQISLKPYSLLSRTRSKLSRPIRQIIQQLV